MAKIRKKQKNKFHLERSQQQNSFNILYRSYEDSYILVHNTSFYTSVVNDKPVCDFSFVTGINKKIRKEYLGTGY